MSEPSGAGAAAEPTLPTATNVRIAGRRVELAPHNCFACGTLNAGGLGLVLHVDGTRCTTELVLDRRFEGWEGIAHGGIVGTILDEVMAWSLVEHDTWGLTARLNLTFRRPVLIGRPIRAEGWVVEAGRRRIRTAGQVVDPASGAVLATAEAVYVPAPEERQRELRERYRFRLVPEGAPSEQEAAPSDGADRGSPGQVDVG